jgi:hypothetical protein
MVGGRSPRHETSSPEDALAAAVLELVAYYLRSNPRIRSDLREILATLTASRGEASNLAREHLIAARADAYREATAGEPA